MLEAEWNWVISPALRSARLKLKEASNYPRRSVNRDRGDKMLQDGWPELAGSLDKMGRSQEEEGQVVGLLAGRFQ